MRDLVINQQVVENLKYMSFGELNSDENFYVIWRKGGGAGFFSNVFHVLGHIMIAKTLKMTPVVDMENFPNFYQEKQKVNNTYNVWEYYFKQPSAYSLEDIYKSKNVYFCNGEFNHQVYKTEDMNIIRSIIKEDLNLNDFTLNKFVEYKKQLFENADILAVHFRGQDMKSAIEHPTPPNFKQIKNKIDFVIKKYNVDKIFVATDEQDYLTKLIDLYPNKIIYTQAFRNNYFYQNNPCQGMLHLKEDTRNLSKYNLGLDVLLDCYLLAQADYFIASGKDGVASGSNVSYFAQCLSDNFKDFYYIYNGMNKKQQINKFLKIVACFIPFKKLRRKIRNIKI
ncbi:MAG: hypothetical protein R3Y43_02700 [Alphaproteobacteria bacterium]